MENIHTILTTIQKHTNEEQKCNVRNRAIGRGFVSIFNEKEKTPKQIWITNRESQRTSVDTYDITGQPGAPLATEMIDTYTKDGPVTSKNTEWGRKLLENYAGINYCNTPQGRIDYEILNSASYNSSGTTVTNLKIGMSSFNGYRNFKNLEEAFKGIEVDLKNLKKKEEELRESQRREKELQLEQERKKQEREQALQKARDKKEARQLEKLHQKEEENRLEKIRREEERQKQLEQERQECEKHLNSLQKKYEHAVSFIRTQASLRLNPILDKLQNDIKFSHVYDGTALVIDGGPGTGKTTTLIQRLKLLINEYDLQDYRLNHKTCKLTDEQLQIVTHPNKNWLFFSPTELLRQYLKENMNYEGLSDTENKTFVWEKYLRNVLRDNYHLFGEDRPFDFKSKKFADILLIKKDHIHLIKSFTRYYIDSIKKKLLAASEIDCVNFKWKHIGQIITSSCKKAYEINDLPSLYRLLFSLSDLKNQAMPEDLLDVHTIVSDYTNKIHFFSTFYISQWQKDKELYDNLLKLVSSWNEAESEEEDTESEEEVTTGNFELKLLQQVRALLRKIALKKIDSQTKISGRALELYNKVKSLINTEELTQLGEYAYFIQNLYPVIRNYETLIFSGIHRLYKSYRKEALNNGNVLWNQTLLKDIVEKNKNRLLHPQEQALLLGFINNLILSIQKISTVRFNQLKHNYAIAYKELCRPVIGIDEATDYCLMDYYAIASLRHHVISSFSMTGDLMQCLKINGITHWDILQHELIFPHIKVKELKVSYRQSPELLNLAKKLYYYTMQKEAPYECYLTEEEKTPSPLWLRSEDDEEKAEWIVNRILEVQKSYGIVPSIAIFVSNPEDARNLKNNIEEIGRLETAGIDIKDCSEGDNLSSNDTVRIFPIKLVKGMEFEVVFFHNIDRINKDLIDKYLYVGLSRATFFMGVTSTENNVFLTEELEKCFDMEGDWKTIQTNN